MSTTPPDVREIQLLATRTLGVGFEVNRVDDGVSTYVYRLQRSTDTFYLRVLPEEGAAMAPEAEVHRLLRGRDVQVPEVIYWDDCDQTIGRAVTITTEIEGRAIGKGDPGAALPNIVRSAGRDLALINQVPVAGFGWIKRDAPGDMHLHGETANESESMLTDLDTHLFALEGIVLGRKTVLQIRAGVDEHRRLFDASHASLAHGDFDTTHIFAGEARYTGIIDLGEIRGTGPYYDLGHFRFHDGETQATMLLPYLLEGYGEAVSLSPDAGQRIALNSLVIGVQFLARVYHRLPPQNRLRAIAAIERGVQTLRD